VIHRYARVESTQAVARALAERGACAGTVVVAEEQTAGRGRLGRRWLSPPGEGLLLTVVLRPEGSAREAPLLSLGAAAALADLFDVQVKWPNDLVDAQGNKLGGLLAELDLDGVAIRHVLLGLGLNVLQRSFPNELGAATSLALLGRSPDREALLPAVVQAIVSGAVAADRLDRWRRRAHTLGRTVRVGTVHGVAQALRDDGALVIDGVAVCVGEIDGGGAG
jgi:BirA family biotin operon repressor/biotin-[acetyl-CoA-carboxylase] ligase